MVVNLSTVLRRFLPVMVPLFSRRCSWFNFRFVTPQWCPKGGNQWCSAAGIQWFSFSRTLHSGEFLPSWGLFEFRPSNWRTIAVLMLHIFHPDVSLLLILLGKDHFFGYYAPVFILFLLICRALTESDICRHFLRLKASAREENLWIVLYSMCISINAPGKMIIFSLEFLKVLFNVHSSKHKMVESRTKEAIFPTTHLWLYPLCRACVKMLRKTLLTFLFTREF